MLVNSVLPYIDFIEISLSESNCCDVIHAQHYISLLSKNVISLKHLSVRIKSLLPYIDLTEINLSGSKCCDAISVQCFFLISK